MENEIKRLRNKIMELEDAIINQGTHAGYTKTLIEHILDEYFINAKPSVTDAEKIRAEYTRIQHFLEIAHEYIYKIKKVAEDHAIL